MLELEEPPDGFSIGEITGKPDGLLFVIQADVNAPAAGYEDNLIVSAVAERPVRQKNGSVKQTRVPLGALPAVPIKIVD
ncbi:MAG TPA: hypothetical protein ENN29_01340 [Candidatus Hydrogenedentes bacterium]|nr:hypothetical protein [Candidatus Hydrogenedentota bacterium]